MDKYGLFGKNIDYSLSPLIHNHLFEKYNINASYQIVNTDEISNKQLSEYKGGNITIPHKYSAYKLANNKLKFKDQSVNTFHITKKRTLFSSTDQFGLIDSIYKLKVRNLTTKKHIIFGDGATSGMLVNTLRYYFKVKPEMITIISRKKYDININPKFVSIKDIESSKLSDYILYNTSPLGSGDYCNVSPFTDKVVKNALAIFDTSYNPTFNKLGKLAYQNRIHYINGLNMLIVQALESFETWTGVNVSNDYLSVKKEIIKKNCPKLIICAMPFAGKTTLYKRHKSYSVDLDYAIAEYVNMPVAEYINENGIEKFREIEAIVLKQVIEDQSVRVVFLGGGTLTGDKAIDILENETVIYMRVSLKTLKSRYDQSRANIQSVEKLEQLYNERDSYYCNIAHFKVGARYIERTINEYMDN